MQVFYISYSLILTAITCVILVFIHRLINEYYSIITYVLNWYMFNIIILCYSLFTTENIWIYSVLTLYLITVYIITKIGNNGDSFILGILLALFQSEYWEISIHVYWHEIFISTFILLSCIIYTMHILNFDYKKFIKYTLLFSIPYFIIVGILYPLPIFRSHYLISDFFFRIVCSVYFISFVYYNNKTYKINPLTIMGDTPESS